jgi:hypothetical protein
MLARIPQVGYMALLHDMLHRYEFNTHFQLRWEALR